MAYKTSQPSLSKNTVAAHISSLDAKAFFQDNAAEMQDGIFFYFFLL